MKTSKNLIKKALQKTTSFENCETIVLNSSDRFRVFYPDLTDCVTANYRRNDERQDVLFVYNCSNCVSIYEEQLRKFLPDMIIICIF